MVASTHALKPLLAARGAPRRSGRRVALLARYPERDRAMPQFISNHGLRMVEASLRAAAPPGLELRVWDLEAGTVEAVAAELIAFDPDVLVINDGELSFLEIVQAPARGARALAPVAGIALPAAAAAGGAWVETAPRPLADLNTLASPYAMDLVSGGGLAVLQTYRGCPFTCSFCEWGTLESPRNVRSSEQRVREIDGMARQPVGGALLVDAGLNLNPAAFAQLREAADRHGFFAQRALICEVYPA